MDAKSVGIKVLGVNYIKLIITISALQYCAFKFFILVLGYEMEVDIFTAEHLVKNTKVQFIKSS